MDDRMTLTEALKELGWTKADLSRALGVHVNTVTNWRERPPGYAWAYLTNMLAIKRLADVTITRKRK